jgi:hypothetical protein
MSHECPIDTVVTSPCTLRCALLLLLPLPPPLPCRSVSRRREPKEAAAVRLVNKLLPIL